MPDGGISQAHMTVRSRTLLRTARRLNNGSREPKHQNGTGSASELEPSASSHGSTDEGTGVFLNTPETVANISDGPMLSTSSSMTLRYSPSRVS
jgi:hypothetical protein